MPGRCAESQIKDVLAPDYEKVNRLRIECSFTGYSLANVIGGELEPSWTDILGDNLAPEFKAGMPDWSVGAFLQLTQDLPANLVCRPPAKLGGVGWRVNGSIVNRDVVAYQERLAILHKSGLLSELTLRGCLQIHAATSPNL